MNGKYKIIKKQVFYQNTGTNSISSGDKINICECGSEFWIDSIEIKQHYYIIESIDDLPKLAVIPTYCCKSV